jgi:hypothetical protein
VILQLPVPLPRDPDKAAWQVRVPSETVTSPAGAGTPDPVNLAVTEILTVIGWPLTGLGVVELIVVALDALATFSGVALAVAEESKFASPGYEAVNEYPPATSSVMSHEPLEAPSDSDKVA